MKIGLLVKFKPEIISEIQSFLPDHEIIELETKSETILKDVEDIDVLIGANTSNEIIEASKKLKLFHVPWVGLDRINFEALQKKNVPICNSKWNDRLVAEYALTLLLVGFKHIIPIHNDFSQGSWKLRATPSKLLTDSNVMLLGFGSIGKELAKLLRPFTSNIIALRNNPDHSTPQEKDLVAKIIGWESYFDEIKSVDIVINSLPLTPQTTGILTEDHILAMQKGTYFVTVGRGKTVDEKALYEALQTKHLTGAAIDVWYKYKSSSDPEPFYPSQYPFHELDNVIMSPHRAATFSDTSSEAIWRDIVYNINALVSNKPLRNVVSYEKRY